MERVISKLGCSRLRALAAKQSCHALPDRTPGFVEGNYEDNDNRERNEGDKDCKETQDDCDYIFDERNERIG